MPGPAFTVDSGRLAKVLAELTNISSRNAAIPIARHVLIEALADGTLKLSATDIDVLAVRAISADVREPGATTVAGHRLKDIAANCAQGSQLSLTTGDGAVRITSGRASFRVSTLPAADFPPMPFGEPVASFSIEASALRRALSTVKHSICTQEARYWLCGTYMHAADGLLLFVSTDGDRMTRVGLPAPPGAEAVEGIIIPPTITAAIDRAAADDDGEALIEVGKTKLRATIGDTVITGRSVEGVFPDYRRAITNAFTHTAVVDRDSLEGALNRILLLSEGKSRAARLVFQRDKLTLRTPHLMADEAIEELPCDFDGDEFVTGFNGQHLRDSLRALDADVVRLGMNDPDAAGFHPPTVLTSEGRADALLALSPMRA